MLRAVIIDDEKSGREVVSNLLLKFCKNVTVIGEANGVKSGIEVIQTLKPDLVLLDVQMQDGTGFDLLKEIGEIEFKVIFVTAFQEFAIKAFQCSAIDYLLKPVASNLLVDAIAKAQDLIESKEMSLKISSLLSNISGNASEPKKIILKTAERIYAVQLKDIIRCQSDGSYTEFYLTDGKKILVSQQLKKFDELLNGHPFIRVHQSHLININFFDYFEKTEDAVVMKDKSSVPVANRKKSNC